GARPGGPGRGGPGRPPPRRPRPRMVMVRRDPLKRLNIGLLLIAFVLSLFAGRLVQLQGMESAVYTKMAIKQRLTEITLPAVRGDITDAQGKQIAMTVEARAIFADPVMVRPDQRAKIAQTLAPMLGLDQAQILRSLTPARPDTRYVVLAHNIPPDQARMVMALSFTGIGSVREYRRVYPSDTLAANVVGFVNQSGSGGAGLESGMNRLLGGRPGWQRVETSRDGQHIPMGEDQTRKPIPGRGLRLTLLQDLQYHAEKAIAAQVKAVKAASGSVIVMDPRTGQILAMASSPTFNPNHPASSKPADWTNRVVQEAFEPGSTNKVITAAAVLEKGGITPQTPFTVPDHIKKYDAVLKDSHPHATERLTFGGVLAKSSNVGTVQASEHITGQQLYQFMRDFGYGQPTGVGLPGETMGQLPAADKWSGTQRYTIAYGQGVTVNALQVASVYATIANKGVRVTPTIIAGTTDERGTFTPAAAPPQRRVITERTAQQISDMLEGATSDEGTAPKAQIPGYRVAGKTGTAEKVDPRTGRYSGGLYTASFAGFAPADDPQLVVQVVLQDPRRGHYGGTVAAPVFKDVMSFALQTRGIPPTGSRSPTLDIHPR
ncbi:peptidoglycan D,D-transpeptidase FtsI family protein, partial [Actinomadura scrupuli]|uniref:peptidoglycan D,D-transpeptidase FtsI family protein n=1 Tax=Actinomadura scrupuli TaxID=559629 RepID=UPI003D981FB5